MSSDDNKVGKVLAGVLDVLDLPGGALLRDHKGRDPVVPADLADVRPAKIDADGNVTCLYCGKATPLAQADLLGSDGFACRTCAMSKVVAVSSAPSRPSSRALRIVGGGLVIAGAVAAVILASAAGTGTTERDDEAAVRAPAFPDVDLAELERLATRSRPGTVRAEPPWLVIEAGGHRPIRIDTRVFDRIQALTSEEDGPHVLLAFEDFEVALHAADFDQAVRVAVALRPQKTRPRRLPAGPRLTVGDEALTVAGKSVSLGPHAYSFDELCRGAEEGTNLGDEVQAALVWLVVRSEARGRVCAWE